MRLDEIERDTAEEQRVKRLKDTAKAAKRKASDLATQADIGADRLKVKKSRDELNAARAASSTAMIRPHA